VVVTINAHHLKDYYQIGFGEAERKLAGDEVNE
jgi:hypothetical protein